MRSKEYRIKYPPVRWVEARDKGSYLFNGNTSERQAYIQHILNAHGEEAHFEGPLHLECIFYLKPHKLIRMRSTTDNDYGDPSTLNLITSLITAIHKTNVILKNKNQISAITVQRHLDKHPRVFFRITEME